MSGRNHGRVRRRREETRRTILPSRFAPRSLRSVLSLKARGRFSEATGAGGIRVELDYTAKGYIYRARMYAEARTSPQRGRPCGFSLDATSRMDSRFRIRRAAPHPSSRSRRRVMDCPTFFLAAFCRSFLLFLFPVFLLSFLASFIRSFLPSFLSSFLLLFLSSSFPTFLFSCFFLFFLSSLFSSFLPFVLIPLHKTSRKPICVNSLY